MAHIMIGGGYDEDLEKVEIISALGACLGKEVIRQGHHLLTGGQTDFDRIVACAAAEEAGGDASDRITSYVLEGVKPSHQCGRILRSELASWESIGKKLRYPEPIYNSDVVILVGGWEGTYRAANWARIAEKPIVPIAGFGLAARDIYQEELKEFETKYADRIKRPSFEVLNQILDADDLDRLPEFAAEVLSLAEQIIAATTVFVIMSFKENMELEGAYNVFKEVTKEARFDCYRVDDIPKDKDDRIIPAIIDGIQKAAFVIADVTYSSPNIYYELGLAHGAGKNVIVTAKEGTDRPFDIYDLPIAYYSSLDELGRQLKDRVEDVAKKFGR